MLPGGEEAPESLPIRGAGRNPLHTLLQLLRAGGHRKLQAVERFGADPAERFGADAVLQT